MHNIALIHLGLFLKNDTTQLGEMEKSDLLLNWTITKIAKLTNEQNF